MGILDKLKNDKPPEILYHYTTAKGLLGIFNTKSIWATHVSYLNDEQEFVYITTIFKKIM